MAASAPSATAAWQPSGAAPAEPAEPAHAPAEAAPTGTATRRFRFGQDDRTLRDPPLPAGEIVGGRYRIVRVLGEGGMGRVYEAEHVTLPHKVAVKLLRRDRDTAEHLARFRQEAEAAARIGHPAIVGVTDFAGKDEPLAYMVMELLRGESLEAWLARPGRLRDGLVAMAEVARGLQAAHAAGVVHRDLKPANLFLHRLADGRLQPKILDFGIAKLASTEHTAIATAAGTVLGTPYYLAPERALGRPLDARADLYSLGVILYEITTGTVPFVDNTFMGVLAKHVKSMPLDPRQAAPDRGIPDGVANLTMALLAKEPAARPPDASAVAVELERLLVVEAEAIANVVTGPREASSDALATVHIDEIAERPTSVPGELSNQSTSVQALVATPGSGTVPSLAPPIVVVPPASVGQSGRTRALGSNAMRDGLPPVRGASKNHGAIAIAAVVIGIGGFAGWWIAREGTRAQASEESPSVASPPPVVRAPSEVRVATPVAPEVVAPEVVVPEHAAPRVDATPQVVAPPVPEPEVAPPVAATVSDATSERPRNATRTRKPKPQRATPTATPPTPATPTPATPTPKSSTLPAFKD